MRWRSVRRMLGTRRTGLCCCFQAEEGIGDCKVTGVQTCALPISNAHNTQPIPIASVSLQSVTEAIGIGWVLWALAGLGLIVGLWDRSSRANANFLLGLLVFSRSEERRVGEEWRSRWSPYPLKKKK